VDESSQLTKHQAPEKHQILSSKWRNQAALARLCSALLGFARLCSPFHGELFFNGRQLGGKATKSGAEAWATDRFPLLTVASRTKTFFGGGVDKVLARLHNNALGSLDIARPHPCPMASQARHKLVSPKELCASRNVVPQERVNRPARVNNFTPVLRLSQVDWPARRTVHAVSTIPSLKRGINKSGKTIFPPLGRGDFD
jgi:hypothetical protein